MDSNHKLAELALAHVLVELIMQSSSASKEPRATARLARHPFLRSDGRTIRINPIRWIVLSAIVAFASQKIFAAPLAVTASWNLFVIAQTSPSDLLSTNLLESSSPWMLWFTAATYCLAQLTSSPVQLAYNGTVLGLCVTSIHLCSQAIYSLSHRRPWERLSLEAIVSLVLLFGASTEFGDTSHLMLTCLLPYILLTAVRLQGVAVSHRYAIGVGMLAACGLCLDMNYAIGWLASLVLLTLCKRYRFNLGSPAACDCSEPQLPDTELNSRQHEHAKLQAPSSAFDKQQSALRTPENSVIGSVVAIYWLVLIALIPSQSGLSAGSPSDQAQFLLPSFDASGALLLFLTCIVVVVFFVKRSVPWSIPTQVLACGSCVLFISEWIHLGPATHSFYPALALASLATFLVASQYLTASFRPTPTIFAHCFAAVLCIAYIVTATQAGLFRASVEPTSSAIRSGGSIGYRNEAFEPRREPSRNKKREAETWVPASRS